MSGALVPEQWHRHCTATNNETRTFPASWLDQEQDNNQNLQRVRNKVKDTISKIGTCLLLSGLQPSHAPVDPIVPRMRELSPFLRVSLTVSLGVIDLVSIEVSRDQPCSRLTGFRSGTPVPSPSTLPAVSPCSVGLCVNRVCV